MFVIASTKAIDMKNKNIVLAGLGSFLALLILGFLNDISLHPLLVASFGASAVLLFVVPDAPFSQPKNVIFGHLICAAIGLIFVEIPFNPIFMQALALGVAIMLMMAFKVVHPASGSLPIIIFHTHPTPLFILFPVFSGTIILVATAYIYNKVRK